MPAAVAALILLSVLCGGTAQVSAETQAKAASADAPDPAFATWLASLREEARDSGISEATLDAALQDVALLVRVIELDRRQPEFTQTFWQYLDRRVTDTRVERGRMLLEKHGLLLNEIQASYGVPARYLIALWGLETNFGDYMGNNRVIDALVTLAYDQRRARFFRAELLQALKIIDQGHITPDGMMGSWAGAMGHMQFMPSTFMGYAVDHTGDGRKDIWGSLPDAFSSAANFLANSGWQAGELWGREVRLPARFDLALADIRTRKTIAQWSALGVRRAAGGPLPPADMEGAIVMPQGQSGPAFLVYDNFRVIMRWNRSVNYAVTVGHLADRIVGMPPLANGREADHAPLTRSEIMELQQLLNQLGFVAGAADGLPGPSTQSAIRDFQKQHALPPDGYPSPALLQRLRQSAPPLS
ncbi:lytic murein transglycosylase [Desulfatitalea alkaliphila]|uniref:Lytic murein transglycosylase n=1 Tax=Desulfatitalea alkaliphila TaxID=2929485 RepID=A0AA41R6N8_9BACT|nr:lytic murein transglycosylase [Desulfatitalea alkaliphila]